MCVSACVCVIVSLFWVWCRCPEHVCDEVANVDFIVAVNVQLGEKTIDIIASERLTQVTKEMNQIDDRDH